MSSPILIQMNPQGKWENTKPESVDEERLRAVVQHLITSQAVTAAQSYCCQCAEDSQVGFYASFILLWAKPDALNVVVSEYIISIYR